MRKLFVFDMDGTIVDKNSKIIPETIVALKEARAKGHMLAIATGRPLSDIIRDIDPQLFDYLIANNGTYFYDVKSGKKTYLGSVKKQIALDLIEVCKKYDAFFVVHTNGQAYRLLLGHASTKFFASPNDPNFDNFKWYSESEVLAKLNSEIAQVSLRSDIKTIQYLANIFRDKYKDDVAIHIANEVYLDINPKGISKLSGLKKVLELNDLSLKHVVSFGDSGNDIQMLRGSGLGIAMMNGNDDAKKAANIVIGSHNTNAISKKIRELI